MSRPTESLNKHQLLIYLVLIILNTVSQNFSLNKANFFSPGLLRATTLCLCGIRFSKMSSQCFPDSFDHIAFMQLVIWLVSQLVEPLIELFFFPPEEVWGNGSTLTVESAEVQKDECSVQDQRIWNMTSTTKRPKERGDHRPGLMDTVHST